MNDYNEFLNLCVRGLDETGKSLVSRRKISSETAKKCKVSNDGNLIIFPYGYQKALPLRFKVINAESKKQFFSQKNDNYGDERVPFFNQKDFKQKDYIIITEGEWDCLSWIECGYENVISLPNGINCAKKAFEKWYEYLNSYKEIYISFDNDEAARPVVEEIKDLVDKNKWRIIHTVYKDANDCLKAGLTKEEMKDIFQNAERYHPSSSVHASKISIDSITGKTKNGMLTHYPVLDATLRGFYPGQVTVISGDTGLGKTTFAMNLIHRMLADGRGCWISSHEMQAPRLLRKIAGLQLKSALRIDQEATEEQKKYLEDWFKYQKLYVNPYGDELDIEKLREAIEYLKNVHQINLVYIEDIGFLSSSVNSQAIMDRVEKVMKEIHILASRLNVHILVVCHPNQVKKGDSVSMHDLKGSSAIKQYADNILVLQRYDRMIDDPRCVNLMGLKVAKNRNYGIEKVIKYNYLPEMDKYEESL